MREVNEVSTLLFPCRTSLGVAKQELVVHLGTITNMVSPNFGHASEVYQSPAKDGWSLIIGDNMI